MRRYLVFALVVCAALAVLSVAATPIAAQGGNYATVPQGQTADGFPILGDPAAKITLVEFSNFSCPGCAQYSTSVVQMIDKHVRTGQARLIFMPMIFGNDPSYIAAQGALCAGKQKGFWEMHEVLFQIHLTQGAQSFTVDLIKETAKKLGLDGDAITTCINAGEMASVIQNSITLANTVGVQYTPTLLYSLDGGKTLQWFQKTDGSKYDSSVPPDVVATYVSQAAESKLAQVTLTPSPTPVDAFADLTYTAWKSTDGLLELEYPKAWLVTPNTQNGPVAYEFAPTAGASVFFTVQVLPIRLLRNTQNAPANATALDYMKSLFPDEAAEHFRSVQIGTLSGSALKQTLPSGQGATSDDRDLWLFTLDASNVFIVQAMSPTADWAKLQPVLDHVISTLKLNTQAASAAVSTALAPTPTLTPGPSYTPNAALTSPEFVAWKSKDGLVELEYPTGWEPQANAQNGPVAYVIAPPGSNDSGLLLLVLPISQLGAQGLPANPTPEDYLKVLVPDVPAANIRSVKAGEFLGAGVRQTAVQKDAAGVAVSVDRDLWLLNLDSTHVIIFQTISPSVDWPNLQKIQDHVAKTLKFDVPGTLKALALNYPETPTPGPTATPLPGADAFVPQTMGQGPCVGVKDPTGVTTPNGIGKQWPAPEQVIDPTHQYCAILTTEKGRIVVELYSLIAPKHVNSFVFLAQQGYYDNITWHRVISGFVAQSGDPTGTGSGGPGYLLPLEISPKVTYDRVGALGMARTSDPNSAGSQFFITYAPQSNLNPGTNGPGYTIFGQVVEGMAVAEQIKPRDPASDTTPGDKLISVRIVDVTANK